MRNKANRLEELFVRLVERRGRGRRRRRAEVAGMNPLVRIRRIALPAPSCAAKYGRILRIWGQTLVPPAITVTLYFVIFGSLIGPRIGADGRLRLHAVHRARA